MIVLSHDADLLHELATDVEPEGIQVSRLE
ncbi:unnamed protein product, partial [Rotaria sp. Silwood1]